MFPYQEKERYLTIQGRSRIIRCRRYGYRIPEIKLSGIWLAEQGFFPSKKVKVTIRRDVLLIQPIEEKESEYENKR